MLKTITVDAILFDMDGTLIDSTPGVLKAWRTWSTKYNLGDSNTIAESMHGRRLQDSLKECCGITTEERLSEEIDLFENEVILSGIVALPGAMELVSQLCSHPEAAKKWTIVTSASNKNTPRALEKAGLPKPALGVISANDVSEGKPQPAPYLAGAALCAAGPKQCLVIEDAVSGLIAGRAAGARTLAVCTSTARQTLIESGEPDFIVKDLTRISVIVVDGKLQVTIDQTFVP